ncbi:Leucine-rich repeat-containing protein C10orf11 [Orchesella cincta]|uniref:Leucine-rich repeat-containing protein C10orf11 n=1 Tax=Orchesella cincta TaxID=48709 RepID=A0A1D2NL38_ORCCI|nr:Leucine-rich repeat-containing protein C10orf11 [Orchesella cincta]
MMDSVDRYPSSTDDDPDLSEVCLVGGDLTEFNAKRIGSGLRKIDLSFNIIERLKGLETSAETLEEVLVDNNQLQQIEFTRIFPKLHTLSMNKNQIIDFVSLLTTLKRCTPALRYLSLLGNPGCPDRLTADDVDESDYLRYRYFVIHHLPGLRFLDHKPVTQNEFFESQRACHREANFHHPNKPLPQGKSKNVKNKSTSSNGTTSKSKQGKRKYRYVGKNSEGNRFIKDTDL